MINIPPGLALADKFDEAGGPVRSGDAAQVGVGGQHVVQDDTVAPAVNTMTPLNFIGKLRVGGQAAQFGIVEFVGVNPACGFRT